MKRMTNPTHDGSPYAVLGRLRARRDWDEARVLLALLLPCSAGAAATGYLLEPSGMPLVALLGIGLLWLLAAGASLLLLRWLLLGPQSRLLDGVAAGPASGGRRATDEPVPGAAAEVAGLRNKLRLATAQLESLQGQKQTLAAVVERLQAEQSTAIASLTAAVTLTHDKLVLTDDQGRVRDISPTALELLDHSRTEVLGRRFAEVVRLFDPGKPQPLEWPLDGFLPRILENRSTTPRIEEALLLNRQQHRVPLYASAAAILAPGGALIGALIRLEPLAPAGLSAEPAAQPAGAVLTPPQPASVAARDRATDLPDVRAFERRLDELVHIARGQQSQHALLFLSPDRLDAINDEHGHWAGEEVLWQVAQVLKQEAPSGCDAFRVGSQHFALLAPFTPPSTAVEIADRLRIAVDGREFKWGERSFGATLSIGVVPLTPDAEGHKVLLGLANKALAVAKSGGGNQVVADLPEAQLADRRRQDRDWVAWVRRRVHEGHAHLVAQTVPPVRGGTRLRPLLELQLRIADDNGAWVPSSAFLPSIVRHNLTAKFDVWLLRRALKLLSEQPELLQQHPLATLDLARSSLTEPDFAERIAEVLAESPVAATSLCFEIDARTAINHPSDVHRFVTALQPTGVQFALDRCKAALGLNALSTLPIQYVKIHEALVHKALKNPVDHGYVRWINQVTHDLGRLTIACGVDDADTLAAMREIGVDYGQGLELDRSRRVTAAPQPATSGANALVQPVVVPFAPPPAMRARPGAGLPRL